MLSPGVFHTVGQSSEVQTCHLPPSAFVLSLLEGWFSNNIFNRQYEEKGIGLAHRLTKLSDSFGNNESSLRTSHDCLSLGLKMTCAQTPASYRNRRRSELGIRMIFHFIKSGVCGVDCSLLLEETLGTL